MYKKAIKTFALATILLIYFIEEYYIQHTFSSYVTMESIFKIANQQPTQQSPPTATSQESPTTPTFSQTNHPQSSARVSFRKNPYTFEERHSLVSEPVIDVVRHTPLSEPH